MRRDVIPAPTIAPWARGAWPQWQAWLRADLARRGIATSNGLRADRIRLKSKAKAA